MSSEEMLELLANDLLCLDKICEDEEMGIFAKLEEESMEEPSPDQPKPLSDSEPESGSGDRFQLVSEEDCDIFIKENENKNTYYKTKSDIKLLLNDWMKSVSEHRDLEDIPPQELDVLLARFFLAIRKRDGTEYEPGTLTSIQYSIDRHLKEKKVNFSIRKDDRFSHSNQVLISKRKHLKAQGKGNLKAKAEPLTTEEFQKLRDKQLLGKDDAQTLLQTVWLNNGVYFGMRGRQDHTNLLWGDIELKRASDDREYLEFTERSTKTRNGSSRNSNREVAPKVFATPGDEFCPVAIYKEYRRRRPVDMLDNNSRFYLQPINTPKTDVWYSHQPVGKNKLGQMMKHLAEKGKLEGRKVNHSTRRTFAQTLVQAGRPPTEIAHLGGWKSLQTINAYSTPTLEQQAQASDILSDHMRPSSSNAVVSHSQCHVQTIQHENTSVLADITPVMNTSTTCNSLDASRSVSSNISKQHSNPFAVLCGANISGGTFNINIVAGREKRKFSSIENDSSQESV